MTSSFTQHVREMAEPVLSAFGEAAVYRAAGGGETDTRVVPGSVRDERLDDDLGETVTQMRSYTVPVTGDDAVAAVEIGDEIVHDGQSWTIDAVTSRNAALAVVEAYIDTRRKRQGDNHIRRSHG